MSPIFFPNDPEMSPRTLCACQSVAFMTSARVAPSGRRKSARATAFLLPSPLSDFGPFTLSWQVSWHVCTFETEKRAPSYLNRRFTRENGRHNRLPRSGLVQWLTSGNANARRRNRAAYRKSLERPLGGAIRLSPTNQNNHFDWFASSVNRGHQASDRLQQSGGGKRPLISLVRGARRSADYLSAISRWRDRRRVSGSSSSTAPNSAPDLQTPSVATALTGCPFCHD